MTNVPDDPERDPQLDAAWRAHSAEMPPAKLDAAILAAAHRAVGSKPTGSAPLDAGENARDAGENARDAGKRVRAATGPQRWWMPFAAAATIGAVALGILQTAPPDQPLVAPSSDMRAAPAAVPPRAMSTVAPDAAPPAASPPAQQKLDALERKDAPLGERGNVAPQVAASAKDAAATPAPGSAPRAKQQAASVGKIVAPRDEADAVQQPPALANRAAPPPPAAAFADRAAPRAQSPGTAPPPANTAPEPFPAEKKNEATDAVTSQPARPSAALAPATTSAPATNPAPPTTAAPAATPAPSAAPARMAAASEDARQRNDVAQSAAAPAAGALAKTRAAESGAMKAVDVDAAIVRIRKLHDDGKLADAAKELVALRAAVPDADRRLPPELRAWAATVKP